MRGRNGGPMMYICDECDAVFEEPVRKQEYSEEYGNSIAYYCPRCGTEDDFRREFGKSYL
jgi:hypothetical protein